MTAHGLIDTTEMYLRTVFELEEEGITPLRARIAERLGQSGPTVSQTVARMERDGLVHVENDRQLSLSDAGRTLAMRVMRKHRLAECLLVGVIRLPWEEVHIEACRWEHVISENVERRLLELLDYPVRCPHGNIIPGLEELGLPPQARQRMLEETREVTQTLAEVAAATRDGADAHVIVRRIGEQVQSDLDVMHRLRRAGIQPGREVILMAGEHEIAVTAAAAATPVQLPEQVASHVFVSPVERAHVGLG